MKNDLLIITPPFTQLNTPYPAGPVLKRYLISKNFDVKQADLSIELFLKIFSKDGLAYIFSKVKKTDINNNNENLYFNQDHYISSVEYVINYMQGKDTASGFKIASENFLPQGKLFENSIDIIRSFSENDVHDKALFLSTIFIEEISKFITSAVDRHFSLGRYSESTGIFANNFSEIEKILEEHSSPILDLYYPILDSYIKKDSPKNCAFTIPFPGNLIFSFYSAKYIKKQYPEIKILFGGGFANTELRNIKNISVFDYCDYLIIDDGELPIEKILQFKNPNEYIRTFYKHDNGIVYSGNDNLNIPFNESGWPDYSDLDLNNYLSFMEITNPMHRLWNEGHWNKMILAHGCYHAGCAFCDTSLDYIKRYAPCNVETTVDRMEILINETNHHSFHFTDEAAPPNILKKLSLEILRRNLKVSWWTNIRFEKNFTPDLCRLMSEAGCIAVAGGLETATDPILKKINKGVSFFDASYAAYNLSASGIMVHAYLMYGFPGQNSKDTVTALENVRTLFKAGAIQSAFWHRFSMTAHSPAGMNPEDFNCCRTGPKNYDFALNDLNFIENNSINHDKFGNGLKKAVYNYMHHNMLDNPIQDWFDFKIAAPQKNSSIINKIIYLNSEQANSIPKQITWIGGKYITRKNGFSIIDRTGTYNFNTDQNLSKFISRAVDIFSIKNYPVKNQSLRQLYSEETGKDFEEFIHSELWQDLKELGFIEI